jgi:hypothetical protein
MFGIRNKIPTHWKQEGVRNVQPNVDRSHTARRTDHAA